MADTVSDLEAGACRGTVGQDGPDDDGVLEVVQSDAQETSQGYLLLRLLAEKSAQQFHDAADGVHAGQPFAAQSLRRWGLEVKRRPVHLVLGEIEFEAVASQDSIAQDAVQLHAGK